MTDGPGDSRVAGASRAGVGIGPRIGGLLWAGGTLTILAVASGLSPSGEGHGTHRALGLPGCVWLATFDQPCPTCGMTTSFAHAADGAFLRAFVVQPMGAFLAIGAATTFWFALHSALTGSRALEAVGRMMGPKAVWWGLGGLFAAWAYTLVRHAG